MQIHEDHRDLARLASDGQVVAYFGYGSLVNRHTLRTQFLGIRKAHVSGWRRFWLPRGEHIPALLSVKPEAGHVTQGVVVYDRSDHLPSVDEREAGYHRRVVMPEHCAIKGKPLPDIPLFIYEASREAETAAETGAFVLQSYLDAVMQGFFALYGEVGVRRFVDETEGFETVLLCDRDRPLYPRAVTLAQDERSLFDRLVSERGMRLRPAPNRAG